MTDKVWTVEYQDANGEHDILGVFSTQEAAAAVWESLPEQGEFHHSLSRETCDVVEYPVLPEWGAPVPCIDNLYKPWPVSGSLRSGSVFPRRPWAPRTSGNDSSFWPTAVAQDDNKTPEAHMAMRARMPGGPRSTPTSLQVVAQMWTDAQMWATPDASATERINRSPSAGAVERPTLALAARMWSTPQARDDKPGLPDRPLRPKVAATRNSRAALTRAGQWAAPALEQVVELQAGLLPREFLEAGELNGRSRDFLAASRFFHQAPPTSHSGATSSGNGPTSRPRLSPRFVAWLMGLPIGWTEISPTASGSCGRSAMRSYRSRQRARLSSLLGDWGWRHDSHPGGGR